MEVLNINQDDLKKYKLINSGSEAKIYLNKNFIIKVYGAPEEYSLKKLEFLCEAQQNIKNTKLPYGAVNIDNKFTGCIQEYFDGYNELNILNSLPIDECIYLFKIFLENLDELIQNNIYPIDLFYGNVLASQSRKSIQIIDLDGLGSVIKKQHNKKVLQVSLKQYLSTVLETLFYGDINEMWYVNYKSLLKKYPFKKEYVDSMLGNKLSFELLYEFLEYIQKDEKDLFKNNKKILKIKH